MKITVNDVGQFGMMPDQFSPDIPQNAWNSASNVRFKDGYAQKIGGHGAVMTTPSAAIYHIAPYKTATTLFWIHDTLTGGFADDGTTKTDITGTALSGAAGDRFTSCVLGGLYVQTNQVQVPMYWDGNTANNLATLTGWDTNWRCKAIRSFRSYLVAMNITKTATRYPYMVKWSDAADPGALPASWDETDPTKDAGEQDIAETTDELIDGLALGDTFVLYKERSTYGMQYIGGTQIFRFFRMPGDFGLLTQNCAANTPLGHVCLTASDVVLHNGAGPRSLLDGRARRHLFSQIDGTNYARCFVVSNPARSEVWVCYPYTGATTCTKAAIWNWASDTWTFRDLPNTTAGAFGPISVTTTNSWSADTEVWTEDTTTWDQVDISQADQRLLLASTVPAVYLADYTDKFAGTNITASLERRGLTFGDPYTVKTVTSLVPRVDAPAGTVLSIEVGGTMDAETGPTWSPAFTYTVGTSYSVDAFATGRYLSWRVTSTSTGNWRIRSCDFNIEQRGKW